MLHSPERMVTTATSICNLNLSKCKFPTDIWEYKYVDTKYDYYKIYKQFNKLHSPVPLLC